MKKNKCCKNFEILILFILKIIQQLNKDKGKQERHSQIEKRFKIKQTIRQSNKIKLELVKIGYEPKNKSKKAMNQIITVFEILSEITTRIIKNNSTLSSHGTWKIRKNKTQDLENY